MGIACCKHPNAVPSEDLSEEQNKELASVNVALSEGPTADQEGGEEEGPTSTDLYRARILKGLAESGSNSWTAPKDSADTEADSHREDSTKVRKAKKKQTTMRVRVSVRDLDITAEDIAARLSSDEPDFEKLRRDAEKRRVAEQKSSKDADDQGSTDVPSNDSLPSDP